MNNKTHRKSFRIFRIIKIIATPSKVFEQRLTHSDLDVVNIHRDIYYSTIFALGSAALAFMSQFLDSGKAYIGVLILSVVFFGLALITIISIYFLRILHTISWNYFNKETGGKNAGQAVNKDTSAKVMNALNDSFDLMVAIAYLDLLLLGTLFGALTSYCLFIIANF